MKCLILHQSRSKDGRQKPKQIGIAFFARDRTKRVLKEHFVTAKSEFRKTVAKHHHRWLEHRVRRLPT